MGQSMAQKILARHSDREQVEPGEILYPRFDLSVIHEVPLLEFWQEAQSAGVTRIAEPEKMLVITDHEVPVPNLRAAERQKATRQLIAEQGIAHFVRPGRHGIQHQLAVQDGWAVPGQLVAIMDIHTLNWGAVGCMPIPVVYEFPTILGLGTLWVRVPETIRVHIEGELSPGVRVRDLAYHIISTIGPHRGDYRSIEYSGPTVSRMTVDSRMILCGISVEINAKAALIEPDEVTLAHLEGRARFPYQAVHSDPDAHFEQEYSFDASRVETMVAAPPSPENAVPVSTVAGKKINSAYIGSCVSGTIEELRDTARVLKGRQVHPDVTLLVIPSTQRTFAQAAREGLIEVFVEAGCHVMGPTCSPCYGGSFPMADGEVRICTATRNDRGRMGSMDADIYLASALTVAASAVKGEIADPREMMPAPSYA